MIALIHYHEIADQAKARYIEAERKLDSIRTIETMADTKGKLYSYRDACTRRDIASQDLLKTIATYQVSPTADALRELMAVCSRIATEDL